MKPFEVTGESCLGGDWRPGRGPVLASLNPHVRRLEPLTIKESDGSQIGEAAADAAAAFTRYRDWSHDRRAALLFAAAESLETRREQIVSTAHDESQLGVKRLHGELDRTAMQARALAQFVRNGSFTEPIIQTGGSGGGAGERFDIRRMLIPVGPVAVFAASNFPLAFGVAGGDCMSALAAGCTVVVKAHPSQPRTGELCARAILEGAQSVGAPSGVLSLIQGATRQVGLDLVSADQIEAVGFTGSLNGGRALFDAAASRDRPIPVHAEMGSLNPVFVTEAALERRSQEIAEGLASSIALGNGQFCTKPGLVFLPEGNQEAFIAELTTSLSSLGAGRLLNVTLAEAFNERTRATKSVDGVACLVEGGSSGQSSTEAAPFLFETDLETFARSEDLKQEHFGPACILVRCSSFLEATQHVPAGLTATIHGEDSDIEGLSDLRSRLRELSGRLIWNGFPTGVEVTSAMHHGGPYPATTTHETSVGTMSVRRWLRGVCYQNYPERLLPLELQDENPLGLRRLVDDEWQTAPKPRV